jgi:two-component sensor histidine kinase
MRLDYRSVVFSFSIMEFLGVFLLCAFTLRGKPGRREMVFWTWAYALITVGATLIALRGAISDWLSVVLGNALVLEGPALVLGGIRVHRGRSRPRLLYAFVGVVTVLWFVYFSLVHPSMMARLAYYDIASAALFAAAAKEMLDKPSAGLRAISRIIAALLIIIAATDLARLGWMSLRGAPKDLMDMGRMSSILIVAGGAAISAVAIGFVILHFSMVNAELASAASDRSLLLREMAHRTKNDLLLVDSLISIDQHRAATEDPRSGARLASLRDRIRCVAQAHEGLSRSESPGKVRLDEYLEVIAQGLQGHEGIQLERSFQKATGPFSLAAPLGLVMNELATNAIKYAFPEGKGGRIALALRVQGEGRAELEVKDDGIGTTWPPERQGLGTAIVQSFTDKIDGTIAYSRKGGSVFRLSFDLEPEATAG